MTINRALLIVLILSVFIVGGNNTPLVRLNIINKSGVELFIRLDGTDSLVYYSLKVPIGTRENPVIKTFTIIRGTYQMQLTYVGEWDPVYNLNPCPDTPSIMFLNARGNNRLTFTECESNPPWPGERTMEKIWQGFYLSRRALFEFIIANQ